MLIKGQLRQNVLVCYYRYKARRNLEGTKSVLVIYENKIYCVDTSTEEVYESTKEWEAKYAEVKRKS